MVFAHEETKRKCLGNFNISIFGKMVNGQMTNNNVMILAEISTNILRQ